MTEVYPLTDVLNAACGVGPLPPILNTHTHKYAVPNYRRIQLPGELIQHLCPAGISLPFYNDFNTDNILCMSHNLKTKKKQTQHNVANFKSKQKKCWCELWLMGSYHITYLWLVARFSSDEGSNLTFKLKYSIMTCFHSTLPSQFLPVLNWCHLQLIYVNQLVIR